MLDVPTHWYQLDVAHWKRADGVVLTRSWDTPYLWLAEQPGGLKFEVEAASTPLVLAEVDAVCPFGVAGSGKTSFP
jgi:hypothetical protein